MQRFSIGDAAELAGDVGPDQRLIGVLIELDAAVPLARLRGEAAAMVRARPILSRRFVRRGRATWRAVWQQVEVQIPDHVYELAVDDPTRATERLMVEGLPDHLPMWRLVLLQADGRSHLLFIAHHVVLDGASAMDVVGALLGVSSRTEVGPSGAHRAVPRRRPWRAPLGMIAGLAPGSSASSLLVPIRSGFSLGSADVPLAGLLDAVHAAGATVNDALLLAVAEALRVVAEHRGERLRRVVVSVPVAGPPQRGNALGRNQVGAFVVGVPTPRRGEGDRHLLRRIAARTRWRASFARGSGGTPPLLLLLAGLGYLGWYRPLFSRQRAITTLLTNLRGPADVLSLGGARVLSLTPVSPALGNVTVLFAAVSYAGTLRITARLDRSAGPDQALLLNSLQAALTRLAGPS